MVNSHRFLWITTAFVACLITANVIAVKLISIGPISVGSGSGAIILGPIILPAAIIVFPFSYIFGDVLTEVYGYRQARRVIWLGFGGNLIFVIFAGVGQLLPPAPFWEGQPAYEAILGYAPRLLGASFAGYLVGEFTNSLVLSKMKILTRGRWLWSRTIGSTVVGQGLDTAVFITIAFAGTPAFAGIIIVYHWLAKTAIEVVATPFTYAIVNTLKKKEKIDTFDRQTRFNPFLVWD